MGAESGRPPGVLSARDELVVQIRLKIAALPSFSGHVVYAVQSSTGPVKFGIAEQLRERFAALCHGSPVPLKCLGWFKGGRDEERIIHSIFAADRLHGEWFQPTPPVLSFAERFTFAQLFRRCDEKSKAELTALVEARAELRAQGDHFKRQLVGESVGRLEERARIRSLVAGGAR